MAVYPYPVGRLSAKIPAGGVVARFLGRLVLAVGGGLMVGGSAFAADVFWSANQTLAESGELSLNMFTGEVTTEANPEFTYRIYSLSGPSFNATVFGGTSDDNRVANTTFLTRSFAEGAPVSAEEAFQKTTTFASFFPAASVNSCDFPIGTTGYAGVSFIREGATYYGWVGLIREPSPGNGTLFTLTGFGYNSTPDEAATAGLTVVPEPSQTAAVLIGGILLLAGMRRRAGGFGGGARAAGRSA